MNKADEERIARAVARGYRGSVWYQLARIGLVLLGALMLFILWAYGASPNTRNWLDRIFGN